MNESVGCKVSSATTENACREADHSLRRCGAPYLVKGVIAMNGHVDQIIKELGLCLQEQPLVGDAQVQAMLYLGNVVNG